MIVFLVPVGGDRYQLYVEMAPEEVAAGAVPQTKGHGWIARQVDRFRDMLTEAERARLRRESGEADDGTGLWKKIMRKVAEAVAEQRLLWSLRHQSEAEVRHPDDMTSAQALQEVKAEFTRDVSRHLRWAIVDGVLMIGTAILFTLIPGPNLIAWYFTFRAIGHFLSWRGARRGLMQVEWKTAPCAPLSDVRRALELPGQERRERLCEIGESLGLKHLAGFVDRMFARGKTN